MQIALPVAAIRVALYLIPGTNGTRDGVWLIFWVAIEANVALIMVSATAFRGLFGQRAQKRGARRRAQAAPHDGEYYYASDSGATGSRSRSRSCRFTAGNRSRVTTGSSRASHHQPAPGLWPRLAFWRRPDGSASTGSDLSKGGADSLSRTVGGAHAPTDPAPASIAREKRWSVHVAPALPGAAGAGSGSGSGRDLLDPAGDAPRTPDTASSVTAGGAPTRHGPASRTTCFDEEAMDAGLVARALDPRMRVGGALSREPGERVEVPEKAVLRE